tara:strand:- start:17152 stop:17928 length:777 start_codon:yes stop_codon:yes gene_type:complete
MLDMAHDMFRTLLVLLLASFAGCVPFGVSGQVGYTQMKVGGELALTTGSGALDAIEQGIDSAFGLGDGQGSPYLRGQMDFGAPVVSASIFWLRESGQGQLADSFGGLVQGTAVDSRLDLAVAKLTASYDFDLGLVKVSPGVLFDVFALDFQAREQSLMSSEEIDDIAFLPMAFLRAETGLGPVSAIAELGYLEFSDGDDNDGQFLDFEAMIEWYPLPLGHVFAGYRYIRINGEGDTGSGDFATDLQIQGWVIGGGVRF